MLILYLLTLLVLTTAEPLSGSCSFAQSTCGYTSDPAFAEWTRSADGHFLIVNHTLKEGVEKAILVSPELELRDWSCLRVVYQITGSGSLWLYQRPEGQNFDTRLWATDTSSDSWLTASVDLRNSSVSCKVIFEGHLGPEAQSSVAIIKVDIIPGYCIECDFEEPNLCAYSTPWSPGVSWYVGGSSAHPGDTTWSNETGRYMYANSVFGKEVAKLVSPMTTTPLAGCLSFYYRSDQESECFFNVLTRDQFGQYRDIWRAEINRTSGWMLAQVDFRAPYPLEVVFEVAFNSHVGGRVALDDISFSPQFCYSETEVTFDPSVANCDFEEGLCRYKPEQAGWSRVSVKPNIFRLGDHTTGSGSFLMANTHLIPPPAYMSLLYGPPLPGNLTYCLRFYYTLNGFTRTDQALTIYSSDHTGGAEEAIWTLAESTRNVWTEAHVTFQRRQVTKVLFVSMCSNVRDCGSVGLDDISMSLGDCRLTAGPLLSAPGTCTFEMGICEFSQYKDSNLGEWVRSRGPTPTSYTGPMGDHTTGTGHYMYIEASQMLRGHRARLVSNKQRGSGSPQCLHFHYHMYGSGTGELRVLLQLDGEESYVSLWSRHGEQGISWMKASVSYQSDRQHQIVFEAIRGTSVRSDIAIDDIVFKQGSCQEMDADPYYRFSENINKIEY